MKQITTLLLLILLFVGCSDDDNVVDDLSTKDYSIFTYVEKLDWRGYSVKGYSQANIGEYLQFRPSLMLNGHGVSAEFVFNSVNEDVFTFSTMENGKGKAVNQGVSKIYISYKNIKDSCYVSVFKKHRAFFNVNISGDDLDLISKNYKSFEYPRSFMESVGLGGLYVIVDYTSNLSLRGYDLACPVEWDGTRLEQYINYRRLKCPKCNSVFDASYGGTPEMGVAKSKGIVLYQYNIISNTDGSYTINN